MRACVSLLPLLGSIFLWKAVFHRSEGFAGYNYQTMIAYFIALIILDAVASPTDDDFQVAGDIKDGLINQVLLKPIHYLGYRFMIFVAGRAIYTAVALVPMALILFFMKDYFSAVSMGQTWLPTIGAVIGSAVLQFMISYSTALLSFWLLEIGSVVFILYSLEFLMGGHVFPLDVLPVVWQGVCLSSPFAYEYFFPVAVFLGRIQGAALWAGFAWQIFWIVFFWGLSRMLWVRGIRHYTAVGG